MSAPIFKEDVKPETLPATVYVYANQLVGGPSALLPYIKASLITKNAEAGDNLTVYSATEEPRWVDYWEIYGDDDLLFQGNMTGPIINPYLTYNDKYISFPSTEQWRAKYPVLFMGYWMARWVSGGSAITFLQEIADVSNKLFWEDGTLPQVSGNLPYGEVAYSSPPYSTITIKRNIPDAEYVSYNTEYNLGYMLPAFVQILDSDASERFKVIVDSIYYKTCSTELGYTLTIPVSTRVFSPENYTVPGMVDIHGDPIVYWRYKLDSITNSSLTKNFYKPVKTQEDYQILLNSEPKTIKSIQKIKKQIKGII